MFIKINFSDYHTPSYNTNNNKKLLVVFIQAITKNVSFANANKIIKKRIKNNLNLLIIYEFNM